MKKAFNFSLFKNTVDGITFNKSKDEKVRADYNGNGSERDGAEKIQIIGIKALSQGGKQYIRLVFIDRNGLDNEYHNAALFLNEKKDGEKQPDYTGSIDLDRDGNERLRLAAWLKNSDRAGRYLSVSVSEFLAKEGDPAAAGAEGAEGGVPGIPVPAGAPEDDEIPF
ncbi:hypothetical protein OI25_8146 (plasmid) [Paraburkholderia fungorum]|jgi:hypothetical protein|uniref:DUF3127 domain-containing protein n=1 Tax=Paraburkholderia fungorum TaxID=134537 RepID=A0AAW3V3K2_9BURK|nr:hypothetical protein [Paraburkholderia fungorum]AJZ56446.1 hypothetical protein OI25_8146 [Paraburkholderia fungorum]MBB4516448.1 hypothetical protein [Paraburkholderia fungorum]MBB5545295.1 hypothetical protein [Paraburkholderia fungorum]MBB6205079.1 hypothetical protein [Paraburkholderia fungorum]MBU7440686.1 DUF736 domain-containing protein [Paraburkholderia fungorum]